MRKKPKSMNHERASKAIERRDVLKGLGVLAVSGSALADMACGASESAHEAATGGSGGAGGSATPDDGGRNAPGTGGSSSRGDASNMPGQGGSSNDGGGSDGLRVDGGAGAGQVEGGHADGVADSGTSSPPMFQDAATCTLTTTDIEGPFFIDDSEIPNDESLIRSDVREGLPGCEFRLSFRLLDAKKNCAPIANAEIYIWHCNADGYYSGFDGQDPSKPYAGSANPAPTNLDRFCRGVQSSDASGIVNFVTIYPGWYAGRQVHLHVVARFTGSANRLITTQLYFPAAFSKEVYESEPAYLARSTNIPASSLNPPSGKPAMPTLTHTSGLVIGTLNVIVNGL